MEVYRLQLLHNGILIEITVCPSASVAKQAPLATTLATRRPSTGPAPLGEYLHHPGDVDVWFGARNNAHALLSCSLLGKHCFALATLTFWRLSSDHFKLGSFFG